MVTFLKQMVTFLLLDYKNKYFYKYIVHTQCQCIIRRTTLYRNHDRIITNEYNMIKPSM